MTPEQIMNGYCHPLCHQELPVEVQCHVTRTKFVCGNEPISDAIPLNWVMLECFDDDYHFTQYACKQAVRCVKADVTKYDLEFQFCAFDLDFDNHGDRPTLDHFAKLVSYLYLLDYQPNLVYQTRGGCRLGYLIEPTTDALWFESHYAALAEQIETPLINADCGYRLDMATRDWTRLFRSARVTRDGVQEFNHQIRLFHTDRLDLDDFRIKSKPARKVVAGNMPFTARDPKLLRLFRTALVPGNRNNAIFAALCHIFRRYDGDAAAIWVECVHEAAINSGLDEAEFESVLSSAQKQPREE